MPRKPTTSPPARGKTSSSRRAAAAVFQAPSNPTATVELQFAEQATRWAQLSTQVATSLLDMQAAWFKEVESLATQLMSPLFARDGHIAFGSAQDLIEPPAPDGPMQLLGSAQKIWSESAKVWLQAMSHDLQDESPKAAVRR